MNGDKGSCSMLGLCNPLLDITAYVDEDLLKKYKLKANNAILAEGDQENLCKEMVEKYPVEYTAGGSSQNVMRVAAGILTRQQVKSNVMFTGCIGQDTFGDLLTKKAREDGVNTHYAISKSAPTGTCAVCLTDHGKNRSLCAFLGASQLFTEQHLLDNWDTLVANTDIIYITGFLIAVSPASFKLLGEHVAGSADESKRYCLNLSAEYVSQVFGQELDKIMKYVDILFGNDTEAIAYAKHKGWKTDDVEEIARKLCQEEKSRKAIGRLVVVTQGGKPIIVAQQKTDNSVDIKHYECQQIPEAEMVDTNGAGDAFAGGFLSQFVQKSPIEFCIKMGDYAAREIIKMSGVALPTFKDIPSM